jgi:ubiquinol-cytochrome c reductase iron-sulfur subunit
MTEEAEPAELSSEELSRVGLADEGVHLRSKERKIHGPADVGAPRVARGVWLWFALSGAAALTFLVTYIRWPWRYRDPYAGGHTHYLLRNGITGCSFGLAVLALGLGLVAYVKSFVAEEVAVQERDHDGPSDDRTRSTVAAIYAETAQDVGLSQHSMLRRSVLASGGLFGLGCAFLALGGFIRNPWNGRKQAALWFTGWRPMASEKVYLRGETGVLGEIYRVRPEDMEPGSMQTVYPYRTSDAGDEKLLLAAQRAADTPVMLIRLHPGTPVRKRPGQEDFNYGDYYAFSKICTHLGCPASLYDSQNHKSLCPCHQSEFLITEYARPVFGPATRPLPQLPITVDDDGYFVARGDFSEPVGPGFWEEK